MNRRPKIVVIGSSNTDMVARAPRIPGPGETVLGGGFLMVSGGKGANQAVAASRLGGDVTLVARVGTDVFGDRAVANIAAAGVITQHVARDSGAPSGVALIFVSEQGQNAIVVAPGANANLTPADVDAARGAIEACDVVVLQLEVPMETVQHAVALARGMGKRIVLNPAPAQPLPEGLLGEVDVITPNEVEAAMLLGIGDQPPGAAAFDGPGAARALRGLGATSVVVTLGARGAAVACADEEFECAPLPVEAVDTTAAGDCFTGGLVVALGEGQSLRDAVHFANAAAAISVTRLGAQTSMPTRAEVVERAR